LSVAAGTDLEVMLGWWDSQIPQEGPRHAVVIVLARMNQNDFELRTLPADSGRTGSCRSSA
jgi:hypothetical protein